MPEWLQELPEGTEISLHVQPRASRNEIIGIRDGALKVRLTSPPVEGAANKLCCALIAKTCGVAKSRVSVRSGEKSRHKKLLVAGLDGRSVQAALEKAMQSS